MHRRNTLLSIVRTLVVATVFGFLIVVGNFVSDELKEKDTTIEKLNGRLTQLQNDLTIMTNAYMTLREDNINLLRNIDFWKRQREMLMRENHELKGIPTAKTDLPKPPAPPPKGGTNDVAVGKENEKKEDGQKQVPGRLYDKNGKEYIIKNGKKVYIVRKKVPAKPKEPPKEPQK